MNSFTHTHSWLVWCCLFVCLTPSTAVAVVVALYLSIHFYSKTNLRANESKNHNKIVCSGISTQAKNRNSTMCVQCSHCETITCVCIHTHTHSHMHATHLQINVLNSIYISNWNCENVYSMVMVTILLFLLLFANAFNFKLCLFCVYTFLVDLTDKHEFRSHTHTHTHRVTLMHKYAHS